MLLDMTNIKNNETYNFISCIIIMTYQYLLYVSLFLIFVILYFVLYAKYVIGYDAYIDKNIIKNKPYNINKKCAVLISGQVRDSFELFFRTHYYNIIMPLNADVFMCLENDLNDSDKQKIIFLYNPVACQWSDYKIEKKHYFENNVII